MSEKQQKNLNKVMSKIHDTPEGLKNFLKKQIKKLKELEFEKLQEHHEKLITMERIYNIERAGNEQAKMPIEKVKEF